MPNPLLTYVNTTDAVSVYQKIQELLGQDHFIFLAMNQVSLRRGLVFDVPASPAEYALKHQEIEQYIARYPNILNRQGLFFELVEEIYHQLTLSGRQVHAERLRDLVVMETSRGFRIKLGPDGAWLVEWSFSLEGTETLDHRLISIVAFERNWKQVVPWPVVQYLNSGILLYKNKAYATALALMSIAVEATLRDLLSTKGYRYDSGKSKVDIYAYSRAQVDLSGSGYSLTFLDPMPANPSELAISAGGTLPADIKIRREINQAKSRVDLLVQAPPYLIDHLSTDSIAEHGQPKSISGLGNALKTARDTEVVITPLDLPPDVDDVLKEVRNNLVHLSSDSMDVELPKFAYKSPSGKFTVKDFLSQVDLVFDLVADIPRFVNEQYVKLWKAGVKI